MARKCAGCRIAEVDAGIDGTMALVLFLQDYDYAPWSVSALYQNLFDIGGATGAANQAHKRGVEQFVLRFLQSGLNVGHDLTSGAEDDVASGDNGCSAAAAFRRSENGSGLRDEGMSESDCSLRYLARRSFSGPADRSASVYPVSPVAKDVCRLEEKFSVRDRGQ